MSLDIPAPIPLGTRISNDSNTGTIVFAGTGVSTAQPKSLFYGIDWDDQRRGKHNGITNSTQYFELPLQSASFIHYKRTEQSRSLLEQVLLKYSTIISTTRSVDRSTTTNNQTPLLHHHNVETIYSQLLQRHQQKAIPRPESTLSMSQDGISKTTGVHLHQLSTYNDVMPSLFNIKRISLESANIAYILSPSEQWIHSPLFLTLNPHRSIYPLDSSSIPQTGVLSATFNPHSVQSFLPALTDLSLPHNLFTCICQLPYILSIFPTLKAINLSGNQLAVHPPHDFPAFPSTSPLFTPPPATLRNSRRYYHLLPITHHLTETETKNSASTDQTQLSPTHPCYIKFLSSLRFQFTSTHADGSESAWRILDIPSFPWLSFLNHDPNLCDCKIDPNSHHFDDSTTSATTQINSGPQSAQFCSQLVSNKTKPACITFLTNQLTELALSSIEGHIREKHQLLFGSQSSSSSSSTHPPISPSPTASIPAQSQTSATTSHQFPPKNNAFNISWHWILLLAAQGALINLTKLELLNDGLTSLYEGCVVRTSPQQNHSSSFTHKPPHLFDFIYLPTSDMLLNGESHPTHRQTKEFPIYPTSFFPSLQHVLLNENNLQWDSILTLSQCTKLENIELNENSISDIFFPSFEIDNILDPNNTNKNGNSAQISNTTPNFPSLRRLLLDSNPISTLSSLHNLTAIPSLTILSILPPRDETDTQHAFDDKFHDKRLNDVDFFSTPEHTYSSHLPTSHRFCLTSDLLRQLTILALPHLQTLNSKTISSQEKNDNLMQTLPPLVDFLYHDLITLFTQQANPSNSTTNISANTSVGIQQIPNTNLKPENLLQSSPKTLSPFQSLANKFALLNLLDNNAESNESSENLTTWTANLKSIVSTTYQLHHQDLDLPSEFPIFLHHVHSVLQKCAEALPSPYRCANLVTLASSLLLDISLYNYLQTHQHEPANPPTATISPSSFIFSKLTSNTSTNTTALSPLIAIPTTLQTFSFSHFPKLIQPILISSRPSSNHRDGRNLIDSIFNIPPKIRLHTTSFSTHLNSLLPSQLETPTTQSHISDHAIPPITSSPRLTLDPFVAATNASLIHLVLDLSTIIANSTMFTDNEIDPHIHSLIASGELKPVKQGLSLEEFSNSLPQFITFLSSHPDLPFIAPPVHIQHSSSPSPLVAIPMIFSPTTTPISKFNESISYIINTIRIYLISFATAAFPQVPAQQLYINQTQEKQPQCNRPSPLLPNISQYTHRFDFYYFSQHNSISHHPQSYIKNREKKAAGDAQVPTDASFLDRNHQFPSINPESSRTFSNSVLSHIHPHTDLGEHRFTSTFHHFQEKSFDTSSFSDVSSNLIDSPHLSPQPGTISTTPASHQALRNVYPTDMVSIHFTKGFKSTHNDIMFLQLSPLMLPTEQSPPLDELLRSGTGAIGDAFNDFDSLLQS